MKSKTVMLNISFHVIICRCGFKGCNEEFRYHNLLKSHKKIHRRIAGGKGQQRNKYPCTETDCTDVFDNWSSYTIHRKAAHRK
jgi:hypothetical protein